MKKLFVILAFVFCSAGLMAQLPATGKIVPVTNVSGYNGFFLATQKGVPSVGYANAWTYIFQSNITAPVYYTYALKLIDNTGSNTATAVLAGSLDNTYYKTITTVSYTGAGADTTIIGGITSSPLSYKFYKWTITASDTMWIKSIFMNFVPTK